MTSRRRSQLEDFVDNFLIADAKLQEVFQALLEEIENLKASELDPDPTANGSATEEEPVNDWPAAT